MSLSIKTLNNNYNINFAARKSDNTYSAKTHRSYKSDENPINEKGERWALVTTTFGAGLLLGVRLLAELFDGDFLGEIVYKQGKKIGDKAGLNNIQNPKLRALKTAGITGGIITLFVGGVALIYTIYNAPKINYKAKVNTHVKGKDMDVYLKSNKIEQDLYKQINDKAVTANEREKEKLKEQYMLLRMSKADIPSFVKLKKMPQNHD